MFQKTFLRVSSLLKLFCCEILAFKSKFNYASFANIALVIDAGLGDVILASRLIASIKKSYPDSTLACFVKPSAVPLLVSNPFVDQIVAIGHPSASNWFDSLLAYSTIISIRLPHSSIIPLLIRYDGPVVLNPIYERLRLFSRLLSFLSHSYKRFYYSRVHVANLHIDDLSLIPPSFSASQHFYLDANPCTRLPVVTPFLLLNSGGSDPIRQLTASTIELIATLSHLPVILVGDSELCIDATVNICDLRHKTTLSELYGIVQGASCVVSPDSMLVHMTCTTATPLVALMGNAMPETYGPLRSQRTVVLNLNPNCSPCSRTECCVYEGFSCVQYLSAHSIMSAVENLIA